MLRTFTCVGVGLLLASGTAYAQNQRQGVQAQDKDLMRGKIVRVDPDKGTVVIRGADGKEQEFRTSATTKYYGLDNKDLREGLRSKDFRAGADVMYRGQGTTVNELRLGTARPGGAGTNPGGAANPGRPGTPPGGNRQAPPPP